MGHSPCGSVDWNWSIPESARGIKRHSPCGSVDWNIESPGRYNRQTSHSPCGCVDWNNSGPSHTRRWYDVAPRAGAWINSYNTTIQLSINSWLTYWQPFCNGVYLVYSKKETQDGKYYQNIYQWKVAGNKAPNGEIPEDMGRDIRRFFRRSEFFHSQRTIKGQAS